MSGLVQPPAMARQLDWVRVVWPPSAPPYSPLVQKYCIMSAAASYTDFHIDFGGTTVWYHVMHGKKIFYIIPPTKVNLIRYQEWSTSVDQNEVFFGDLVRISVRCFNWFTLIIMVFFYRLNRVPRVFWNVGRHFSFRPDGYMPFWLLKILWSLVEIFYIVTISPCNYSMYLNTLMIS